MNELFFEATEEQRIKGYQKKENYHCLLCDFITEEGIIYPYEESLLTAEKRMIKHIESHGGVFNGLIDLEKKVIGFSDQQSRIMKLIFEGHTDHEIQSKLNVGSLSTIRNHRHTLREKERQAKVMVTLMSFLSDKIVKKVKVHDTATMVDKRYDISVDTAIEVVNRYFDHGKLKTFSMKEKNKIIVLREIMKKFDYGIQYKGQEVDHILMAIYEEDYVLIRRYLIEYGFMERTKDCKFYWVKDKVKSEDKMSKKKLDKNKRKELMNRKYFSEPVEIFSGVYEIKNKENHKRYIGTARNIKKLEGIKFQLNTGSFINKALQKEWTSYGEDAFEIIILESFEEEENIKSVTKKMSAMKKVWIEKLQPFGDQGYHK